MIIDIHTHTFPKAIATRAMATLSKNAKIPSKTDGTIKALYSSMKKNNIDYSVLLPIVTKPSQLKTINEGAISINESYHNKGIISFGSIHPENDNYDEIMRFLVNNNIKGIKLHPVFQRTAIDDIKNMRIIDSACNHGLVVIIHGGYDISYPNDALVTPKGIQRVIEEVRPNKMIMAHMGAWAMWDEMLLLLKEHKVMMDCSFSLFLPRADSPLLSFENFVKMVRCTGANNVFFGSDSPWCDQGEYVNIVKNSGITPDESRLILGDNAMNLLGLN